MYTLQVIASDGTEILVKTLEILNSPLLNRLHRTICASYKTLEVLIQGNFDKITEISLKKLISLYVSHFITIGDKI